MKNLSRTCEVQATTKRPHENQVPIDGKTARNMDCSHTSSSPALRTPSSTDIPHAHKRRPGRRGQQQVQVSTGSGGDASEEDSSDSEKKIIGPERNSDLSGPLSPFTGLQELIHDLICVNLVSTDPMGCENEKSDIELRSCKCE